LQQLVNNVEEAGDWLKRLSNGVTGSRREPLEAGWEGAQAQQQKATPSAKYAHLTIQEALHDFQTNPGEGLPSSIIPSLQAIHGYNEFSVQTPDPLWIKFVKTIYESPLTLLLFGSAIISAVMGNIDDAVSITIAILIVLTGL
jgi:Ca2+-transporting ATPase